jgi:hypothetical protein
LSIYRVRADTAERPVSAPLLISAPAAAVTRLQAFGSSSRSIILEWRDVVRDSGYRIERSIAGGTFATIGTAPQNACGYRDTNITPGGRYAYRVVTLTSSVPESVSESVSALTGVADLSAVSLGNQGVALTWKADHPVARHFVERSVGGPDSYVTIGAVNGNTHRFVDQATVAGEQPRYRVVTVEDVSELNELKSEPCDSVRLPNWTDDEHFFALRYTGKIKIDQRGKYNFYLTSDDGSRLFLDGDLVVNCDGRHVEQTVCGTIELEPGSHDLEVQYFEHDGRKKLELSWAGAVPYAEVPRDILSSLVVHYYEGTWWCLPFARTCAVSDVVNVTNTTAATSTGN